MRYLLFCLMVFSVFIACEEEESPAADCDIVGRWIIDGLEESTLYEFTDELRYSIYSTTPGVFGTIEDAIPNPHTYEMVGDSLIIDLNFGNYSRTVPVYKCDCNVVELQGNGGATILYKEAYILGDCNE